MAESKIKSTFMFGFIDENPIFKMVLGICSALAVTNSLQNTFAMCTAVIFVSAFSSFFVSLIREWIPKKIRMAVYVIIIATFVMIADIILKTWFPVISRALGPYVGLIITNCIIMGRTEAFASNNTPFISIIDAIGVSCGYGFILLFIAFFRELAGFGKILGYTIIPDAFPKMMIFSLAPGAFFTLGIIVWAARYYKYFYKKTITN
jgi:Na+-transporting NADH:ubiquinone oxidoreductase subunit D